MTPMTLSALLDATWPPAFVHRVGPWTVREGQGGGQRVSAATATSDWNPHDRAYDRGADLDADLDLAEAAMTALGQPPLFMIRDGEAALDAALALRGYRVNDPVVAYGAPTSGLVSPASDPMTAFAHWPPLTIATDLWTEAGLGPARLAIMGRVVGPKTVILGRQNDRASGVAFVASSGTSAMLHALEVTKTQRRQGSARIIVRAAAVWAQNQGATDLSLVVTAANAPARGLYASLGMTVVGQYHYRVR